MLSSAVCQQMFSLLYNLQYWLIINGYLVSPPLLANYRSKESIKLIYFSVCNFNNTNLFSSQNTALYVGQL